MTDDDHQAAARGGEAMPYRAPGGRPLTDIERDELLCALVAAVAMLLDRAAAKESHLATVRLMQEAAAHLAQLGSAAMKSMNP